MFSALAIDRSSRLDVNQGLGMSLTPFVRQGPAQFLPPACMGALMGAEEEMIDVRDDAAIQVTAFMAADPAESSC